MYFFVPPPSSPIVFLPGLKIPFKSNILETEQQISKFFNHYLLGYGFELNGKLHSLSVSELFLSPGSVKANIVFYGNLSLGIAGTLSDASKN